MVSFIQSAQPELQQHTWTAFATTERDDDTHMERSFAFLPSFHLHVHTRRSGKKEKHHEKEKRNNKVQKQ